MDNKNSADRVDATSNPNNVLYNVTVKMDIGIADACLQWLLSVHAPQIVATKCFTGFKVFHLLGMNDSEGPTYAIQYFGNSIDDYQRFADEFETYFLNESYSMWRSGLVFFGTLMKAVN